jgi:hypothetical protein
VLIRCRTDDNSVDVGVLQQLQTQKQLLHNGVAPGTANYAYLMVVIVGLATESYRTPVRECLCSGRNTRQRSVLDLESEVLRVHLSNAASTNNSYTQRSCIYVELVPRG